MPVNVGVIGAGEHARRNTLPALAMCDSTSLVGISTRNQSVGNELAGQYQCKLYGSDSELMEDDAIDTIYVALPVGLHFETGMQTILAGKHLWCEKSLTHDPSASLELLQTAQDRDLCLGECFMYRHHPQFQLLRDIAESGKIGKITSISGRFGFPHLDPANIRYRADLGGGALLDAGCYTLHSARLLADSEPVEIYSILSRDNGYDVDTRGAALLGFASGAYAQLRWGFGLSYVNEIELWGESGRARAIRAYSKPADLETEIEITMADGSTERLAIPASNHFVIMFHQLALACEDPDLRRKAWKDAEEQARLLQKIRRLS